MGSATAELVTRQGPGPASVTSMIQRDGGGVVALAMMSDTEFEARLAALKVGQERVRRIQREMMTEDEDYGVIPGTRKPALLKPGAEKICQVYGLVPSFEEQMTTGDGITSPPQRVVTKCHLHLGSAEGPIVGEGVGSANSWERKHRYRSAARSCPKCGVEGTIRRSKFEDKGWYCHDRAGGCGEQFKADDPAIIEQQGGQVENPDPYDVENTLFKMAEKRAHVDATLRATATSGLFTQDTEDHADDSVAKGATPAAASASTGTTSTGSNSQAPGAAAPATGNTRVKDIKTKTGKNARGSWTLYTVSFEDGRMGTTFSEAIAKHAENAKASGALVNPTLERDAKGTKLEGFEAIAQAQPAEQHTADEPVSGPENILTVRQVDTDSGPRWVIQTDKRQLVTDHAELANAAIEARKEKTGLVPAFEVVPRAQGGTVNKLSAWAAPPAAAAADREPGQEG